MAELNYETPSRIRILPRFIIFFELVLLLLFISFMLDSVLDYQEGTFSLQETYLSFGIVFLEFGGIAFIFHYFRYSVIQIDSIGGFSIYSRFFQKNFEWDQIESITFIISQDGSKISISHGLMMIFLFPYFFNTRWVYISLKMINGKEIHQWMSINLGKMNQIFHLLNDITNYNVSRAQVDFSELKGKKYRNPIRDQWVFLRSTRPQDLIPCDIFFRDDLGRYRQKEYSKNAKMMVGFGSVAAFCLLGILYLVAGHVFLEEHPAVWYSFITIGGISFCIGLIYSFITPEMEMKPKKNSRQIRNYLIKEFKK